MRWPAISALAQSVTSGDTTAVSLVEQSLRVKDEQAEFNAIITPVETALRRAQEIDRAIESGVEIGPLAGVPFIVKDNFLTAGIETTAGSNILRGYVPPYSATAVERLEEAGAILVAKANLDAFAHGSSTENSDFGPTLNPHARDHVPGGSSGGSAAAVALNIAPFALGTDTGGSIRLPASFCGVVGLKPTYGLVSRYGVVAMASSTDVIGPMTRTAEDSGLVLDVMSGRDWKDATTIERESEGYARIQGSLAGKKFGLIKEHLDDSVEPQIKDLVLKTVEKIRIAGGTVTEVSLPALEHALAVYYIIVPAEISSNLSRYDGIRYGAAADSDSLYERYEATRSAGFNDENKRRIMIGTYVLSSGYQDAYYRKAQAIRTLLAREFDRAFSQFDALIGPTAPSTAFPFGAKSNPLQMYMTDIMTVAVNLAGIPAISLPVGMVNSLPVGLHIMSPQRTDRRLLEISVAIEKLVESWESES